MKCMDVRKTNRYRVMQKEKKFGEQNNPVSLILMHMGYGINQFIVKKIFFYDVIRGYDVSLLSS